MGSTRTTRRPLSNRTSRSCAASPSFTRWLDCEWATAIADAELIAEMLAQKDAFNVNALGQLMALEALRRQDEFAALRDQLVASRTTLEDELAQLGFHVLRSEFVAVLATHPDHSAEHIQTELLKRGVAVRRFADPETANYVRITIAPKPMRERLFAALHDILG